jgi:hypothetical protein
VISFERFAAEAGQLSADSPSFFDNGRIVASSTAVRPNRPSSLFFERLVLDTLVASCCILYRRPEAVGVG